MEGNVVDVDECPYVTSHNARGNKVVWWHGRKIRG